MKTPGNYLLWMLGAAAVLLLARQWYFTPNVATDQTAYDFTAVRLDGSPFRLSDHYADGYVFLEFWGSWCAPCRYESAEVAFLAREYPELTVVSVALEQDSAAWRRALVDLGKTWPHQIMDPTTSLRFLDGPVSDRYGVNKVPTHFLFGPGGRVLGADVSLPEVLQLLDRRARPN